MSNKMKRLNSAKHTRRKPKKQGIVNTICRDCGLTGEITRSSFNRAAQPRCIACGGMLDTNAKIRRGIEGGALRVSAYHTVSPSKTFKKKPR